MANWIREAISDDRGQADMAFVAIGFLTMAAVLALGFICVTAAISYHECKPVTTIATGPQPVTSIVPCNFDPLPVGQATGLVFGGFATLIGALAGYMAATGSRRRRDGGDP